MQKFQFRMHKPKALFSVKHSKFGTEFPWVCPTVRARAAG